MNRNGSKPITMHGVCTRVVVSTTYMSGATRKMEPKTVTPCVGHTDGV